MSADTYIYIAWHTKGKARYSRYGHADYMAVYIQLCLLTYVLTRTGYNANKYSKKKTQKARLGGGTVGRISRVSVPQPSSDTFQVW